MLSLGLGGHYYNLIRHCQYIHPDRHPDLHYLLFHLDHYHSTQVHSLGIHPGYQDNHHYHGLYHMIEGQDMPKKSHVIGFSCTHKTDVIAQITKRLFIDEVSQK